MPRAEAAGTSIVSTPIPARPMTLRRGRPASIAAALILVSTLALHTQALLADPAASLLVGEPGPKGDPLTHPRLTLQARAEAADKSALRDPWLARHPKTTLYYDFADFLLMRLVPFAAHLNGGFGQAFRLSPEDLLDPTTPA